MDLVHPKHLKRDVTPALAANAGVDAGVAIPLQHDQALAGAERGAGWMDFFRQTQRVAIEPAMGVEIAHRDANADLPDAVMTGRNQADAIAVGVLQRLRRGTRGFGR